MLLPYRTGPWTSSVSFCAHQIVRESAHVDADPYCFAVRQAEERLPPHRLLPEFRSTYSEGACPRNAEMGEHLT
eukprot:8474564-Pyramimonas_sp.AAC.1